MVRQVPSPVKPTNHSKFDLSGMEMESFSVELVTLLCASVSPDKTSCDEGVKGKKRRHFLKASSSLRFSVGGDHQRPKYSQSGKMHTKTLQKIVFASPRFHVSKPHPPQVFDESAPDDEAATAVRVTDSFNPYTSLESGSYSGNSYVPDRSSTQN